MQTPANPILCDGCARPASPAHIAERLARLERATRFRPVHINVLFVAFAPTPQPEDDFYGPPQSNALFDSLMDALDIAPACRGSLRPSWPNSSARVTTCLICRNVRSPKNPAEAEAAISALSPALVRRIRFNYKPKHIVLLGAALAPLIELLEESGLAPTLASRPRQPVVLARDTRPVPGAGFRTALRTALSTGATSENRLSDYDRMQSNQA